MELPFGHELIHQRDEARIVGWFQQMNQFVNNEIFEALRGLLCQLRVETNCPCLVIAASPFGLHPLHEEPIGGHAHQRLPSRE